MSFRKLEPVFDIAVSDMKRVKRATASVNTAIEAVAAFSSDQKLLASLEIEDKEERTWSLTVIPERDDLFNRLVATGNQRWENMYSTCWCITHWVSKPHLNCNAILLGCIISVSYRQLGIFEYDRQSQ